MIAIYREDQKLFRVLSSTIHKVAALQPAVAQAKYCNSFQLTHMPHGNHAQSIVSNGDQKEDKTLLQHSQLNQHGEFQHVSVSERQRSRPCGQNLCVKNGTATGSRWSARAMVANSETKVLISPRPIEFQHQFFTFRSVLDSDHSRIVGQSHVLKHYIYLLCYVAQFFPYQECNLPQCFPYQ